MRISVAGIGASAGGLEAFKLLLAHLPAKTGLAFVFVQHLDPKHHSNLTEILAGVSAIPVRQAADGMEIEPNHLYVIPPDAGLQIVNQVLEITPCAPLHSGPHMPIDRFLRSLAQECGSRAIGVILSGAGTDGTAGLEAVKAAGGVTFAQDPTTAKFSSMPQTAIGSRCVDFVMSPEAIAAELTTLARHPYIAADEAAEAPGSAADLKHRFDPILELLRDATGVDFALYRETTIQRRIMRRLALRNIGSLEEYREHLTHDTAELSALHRDLLINVTRFFRDPESFESLKRLVFPRLVQGRRGDAAIRIWVPGCATGEEAYTIAILFQEYFRETGRVYPVQIFASDISAAGIEKARSGKYAGAIAADVGPERLNRYFSKTEGGYQISKALREMCVFSKHDLMQDPPFSQLDLISCRNVLIYFGSVRKNVLAIFSYALRPGGFLLLGSSETESDDHFSIMEGAQSIYTKNETKGEGHRVYAAIAGASRSATANQTVAGTPAGLANSAGLRKELERTLLSKHGGAGVVVDENLEVLEIMGQAAPYLILPPGKTRFGLLKLIPQIRLFLEIEKLVHKVKKNGEPARQTRVPCRRNGADGEVNIEVIPLGDARLRALLVLFEPVPAEPDVEPDPNSDLREREIARLRQDLVDARQRLLSIMEEHHSSEEESQNTAAEALSANEELLSLNEELETAKEELQSTNEELTTLNQELLSTNAALAEARDLANLIVQTTAAPLLVLDSELRIITANPSFHRAFRISPGEAEGQLLHSISNGGWNIPGLREALERILPDHKAVKDFEIEHDFPGIGRRVLALTARQLDGLEQILLGIEDVTERYERAQDALRESEERFGRMADAAPVMIWVSGTDKACTFVNKGWLDFVGRTLEQELGNGWTEGVHPEDVKSCLEIYTSSFDARHSFQMEYRLRRADGEYRWLLDNGVPRFEQGAVFLGYIGSCIDITDVKTTQEKDFAKQKLETVGALAGGIAHDFNNLLGGILAHSELALTELASGSSPADELERIRVAAIRGAEIVRQLMVYAGQESEATEVCDVSGIAEDMLELLRVSVSKHVKVETSFGKNLPLVRANSTQIRQVAMNLITNASDAIGDQDGVIRVTTGRVTVHRDSPQAASERLAEGEYLQLEITDTGRGMTPEIQARVFDPFFTTKATGSHGQGLVVVRRIVQRLHGTIRLLSAPGEGTTFRILLPAENNTAHATRSTISRAGEETLASREATIFVVDDEDLLRQAVSKMLRKKGLSVIEASSGFGALDVIRAQDEHIDVLLLDVTLPGASSREVYNEAKRLRPGMPVIITSAKPEEMAAASLATRIERFLRKPFRLDDLLGMIREVLPA